MKIMFTVQGDGRGHMTQAIAAAQTLERQGHEIAAVTIGRNPNRTLPEFFTKAFGDRVDRYNAPIRPGLMVRKAQIAAATIQYRSDGN